MIRPDQKLGTSKGHHRFVWDLKYTSPRGSRRQFSIAATYQNTPTGPFGPLVIPGDYKVKLTAGDKTMETTLKVLMDPRVETTAEELQRQSDLSLLCYQSYHDLQDIKEEIDSRKKLSEKLKAFRGSGAAGEPDIMYGSIRQTPLESETIVGLQRKFLYMLKLLQASDEEIPAATIEGVEELRNTLSGMTSRWEKLK